MISGIFLFLAAVCIGLYFLLKKRNESANHYRRKKIMPSFHLERAAETSVASNASVDASEDEIEDENEDDVLGIATQEKELTDDQSAPAEKIQAPISPESDCVIVMYLMAPDGSFYAGYELLQALLSAGLRFGKNRIFARHAHKDGRGDALFYCASAVTPGVFDLTQMGTFSCPGLSLFFSCASVSDPLATFDCLLETIDQLVEDLGGEVLDGTRAYFNKDKMVQYRQQIRAFENSKNTADLFA